MTRAGLALADAEGVPCYLEKNLEKDVVYYRRFGFEVDSEEIVHRQGMRFWAMIRPGRRI